MNKVIVINSRAFSLIIICIVIILNFQPFTLNASNDTSINKISLLWTKPIENTNWGVYTDGISVYTTGSESQYGNSQISLSKYDMDGNSLWKSKRGEITSSEGRDVTSFNNHVYSVGRVQSNHNPYSDIIITQYDDNGKELWTRQLDSGEDSQTWGVDHIGDDLYVTGEILRPFQEKGFFLRYGSDGTLKWSKEVESGRTRLHDIAVDSNSIFIAGTGTRMSNGSSATVFKYDSDGNQIWAKEWEMASEGMGVCISNGGVYVAGFQWKENYQFMDALLIKYNSNGDLLWEKEWGTERTREQVWGMSCGYNRIYITGSTNISSPSDSDMFLLQYDENGTLLFSDTWNEVYYDVGYEISTHGNETFIVGYSNAFRLWKYVDPSAPIDFSSNNTPEESPFPLEIILTIMVTISAITICVYSWILLRGKKSKLRKNQKE